MHLSSIFVKNFKRIILAEVPMLRATGPIPVVGKNGQGKSSLLDALLLLLGGKSFQPSEPIRHDAEDRTCIIKGTLADGRGVALSVTRRITQGGSTLEVVDAAGVKVAQPQARLDDLTGGMLDFDPAALSRMAPRELVRAVARAVGIDIEERESSRKTLLAARSEAVRAVKAARSRLASMPLDAAPPKERVDIAKVRQEASAAEATVREHRSAETAVTDLDQRAAALDERIGQAMAALDRMRTDRADIASRRVEAVSRLEECSKMVVDPAPIWKRLDQAEDTNRRYDVARQIEVVSRELEAAENSLSLAIADVDRHDELLRGDIAAARFPVQGLSFDETGVRLNGVPFGQCSQAEQLRIGLALRLADNPGLKVVLVKDASLLDDDGVAAVAEMAEKAGAQVFLERVDDGEEPGIVMSEGRVTEIRGKGVDDGVRN